MFGCDEGKEKGYGVARGGKEEYRVDNGGEEGWGHGE